MIFQARPGIIIHDSSFELVCWQHTNSLCVVGGTINEDNHLYDAKLLCILQQFLFRQSDLELFIDKMQEAVIKELKEEYGNYFDLDSTALPDVLRKIGTSYCSCFANHCCWKAGI